MFVTVITPSYNRGGWLTKLYDSLKKQTNHNFEWLIVDDGSTDNTKQNIERFQGEADFSIRYIYKENGGKHTALNVGISTIKSEMTFTVDSDDQLASDAIESVIKYGEKYFDRTDICGLSFLRKFPDGKINGNLFPKNELIGSYIDIRVNGSDMNADKAEVFYTHCLKEFPFPEFKDEKFLGEDSVWVPMARKYKMIHINKAIYIGNYLDDGLTKNRRIHNIESPNGCAYRANQFLFDDINIKFREKCAIQYLVYGWFAGKSDRDLISKANQPWLVKMNVFPAKVIFNKWKKEYLRSK